MKFQHILLLIISSCTNQGNETSKPNIQVAGSIKIDNIRCDTNYIDEKGLKQGFWIINDSINNEIREVYYKDNELDSISKQFHFSPKDKLISLAFFQNGKIQWSVMPEYFNNTHPEYTKAFALKGIIIYEDSVYVKVPNENGQTWFEGLYLKTKYDRGWPSGELKSYYPNGQVNTIENWSHCKKYDMKSGRTFGGSLLNGKFQMFDSSGKILIDTNFKMAPLIL
ncbi:MAG: hypothetical protein K9H61_04210 [Bacteroidia bacterium]|nr:hypothetical protein [Bacteroidia bacterium]MCF8426412.1 hypothetical protein [Bacteroidia bacterium]MCF8446180.1 hypothetical protein [Bacteroidia bacterium]